MALPIDPASLASLASLQGTLTSPEGILTLSQALNQRAQEVAQQRTAQATQEASQAGQQYQQAAQAPVQTPDALAQMLPLLTGNIASVIAQDPNFAKRGAQDVAQQRADLAQKRADNLMALKDNYDKKALLAAHLGDNETEMDMRQRSEQLSKTLEVLLQGQHERAATDLENLRQKGRMAEVAAQGRNALDVANVRAGQDATDAEENAFSKALYTTRQGNTFLDMTNFKTGKPHDLAVQYAAGKNATPLDPNASTQMRTIDEVQNGLDQVERTLGTVLPHQTGKTVRDFLTRQAAGMKNAAQAAAQSNSDAAAFASTYPLAIRSLQAVAAGPGSGFRLNQSEINLIQQRWPRLNDNIETAKAKLQWERWFLQNKENTYFKRDWRVQPEPAAPNLGLPATGILSPKVERYDKNGNRLN